MLGMGLKLGAPAFNLRHTTSGAGVFVPPASIAVSDFKNAAYSIGGTPGVYADLWGGFATMGAHDPANIIANTGYGIATTKAANSDDTIASVGALSAALDPGGAGFTAVLDVVNVQGAGATSLYCYSLDTPNWADHYQAWLELFPNTGGDVGIGTYSTGNLAPVTYAVPGTHKFAVTMSKGLLALAVDGVLEKTADPVDLAANNTFIPYVSGGNGSSTIIQKITFYRAQATDVLTSLSSLQ